MKKPHLFIASLFLLTHASRAQDLSSYIPKDATAVATFKSAELFELISLEQFNNSTLGKSINKGLQGKNIEEVGLDLRQDFYYFMLETDSTTTHGILLPMANEEEVLATLQRQLDLGTDPVQRLGDVPYLRSASGKEMYTWKDNCLALLATDIKHDYFWDDSVANRYGIEGYSPSINIPPYDESDYTHKVDSIADSLDYGQDAPANDVVTENPSETWGSYDDYYQKEDSIKGILKVKWGMDKLHEWYNLSAKDALQTDPAFQKSKRKDALASLWVNSLNRIYQGSVPPLYPYHSFSYTQRGIPGVKGAEAHFPL